MSKRTLAQKIETTLQCHACVSGCYSPVGEDGVREKNKGQFYSEQNKLHLVRKGEMRGSR